MNAPYKHKKHSFGNTSSLLLLLIIGFYLEVGTVSGQPCPTKHLSGTSTIYDTSGGTMIWNSTTPPPNPVLDDIYISKGSHFIIDGVTVNFADGVAIYVGNGQHVDDGTQLEIKNGAILQKQSCGTGWTGIILQGNPDGLGRFTQYSQVSGAWILAYNSRVIVDHSTIKNATTGVDVTLNGILHVLNGSHFIDNYRGISIDESTYTDTSASYARDYFAKKTVSTQTCSSASFIEDCTFDFQNLLPGSANFNGDEHIYLYGVKYLEIAGNTFSSTYGSVLSPANRGEGIYAKNSSFSLHESGVPAISNHCWTYAGGSRNSFNFLSRGVTVEGDATAPDYTVGLVNCSFSECVRPVYISKGVHHVLSGDTLIMNSSIAPGHYNSGISSTLFQFMTLYYAPNVLVNKCYFNCNYPITEFILMNEGGAGTSSIYNNTFTYSGSTISSGISEYGVNYVGNNGGAQIRCNAFTGNKFDIYIGGPFNPDIGTANDDAHNIFSGSGPGYYNLVNGSGSPITYHAIFANQPATFSGIVHPDYSVSSELCPDITDCGVWLLSINKTEQSDYHVLLYPNPAHDLLHVAYQNLGSSSRLSMVITDIQGRSLSNTLLDNFGDETDINTSALPNGIYVYQITDNGNPVKQGKFVISR